MRLKLKIMLPIIGLFIVFMGLDGFLAYRQMATGLRASLSEGLEGEATALARALNGLAASSLENVSRMAREGEIATFYGGDRSAPNQIETVTERLQWLEASYENFRYITLLDTEGKIIATSHPDTFFRGEFLADHDFFKEAIKGETFLAAPHLDKKIGKPSIMASAPVRRDGQVVGVIVAAVNLENFFEAHVAPVRVGKKGQAYVLDKNGLIVMAKNQDWLFKENLPAEPIYKEWIAQQKDGLTQDIGNEGMDVLAYHTVDPATGLIAVVRAETDDVFSDLYAMRNATVVFIVCFTLVGASLVYLGIRPVIKVMGEGIVFAEKVAAEAEQLSSQVEQASQGTTVQRDRVGITAAAMDEMNSSALNVAKNADDARKGAESAQDKALGGATLVNEVIAVITELASVTRELADNRARLTDQTESVDSVMEVISDIADQTNILALNAAIEAARARDSGRGFMVVADEVRKLAEKTTKATNTVNANIKGMRYAISQNVELFAHSAELVKRASGLAATSGEALQEILSLAEQSASLASDIAAEAKEQSTTTGEIDKSIEEISRVAVETSENMEEAAVSVRDLAALALQLKSTMERLK